MKKSVSVLVILAVLMMTFMSCGGSTIVGKWEGVYGEAAGIKMKFPTDSVMYLEIKSDGTAIGTSNDSNNQAQMKWKEEKGVYTFTMVDDETGTFVGKLENNLLVLDVLSAKIYMSKDAKNFKYPDDVIDPGETLNP